jgi:hypothetical protein
MLGELRAVATPGTRLALSTSVSLAAGDQAVRERFAASVQAAGEPARNTLTAPAGGPRLCSLGFLLWAARRQSPGPKPNARTLLAARPG